MSRYAILRLRKVHTFGQIAGLGQHMERDRVTPNADPELTPLNERLAGSGDWVADVKARVAVAPIVRKNAVLAIEFMITASPEYFAGASTLEKAQRRDAWRDAAMGWLGHQFGAENVVAAIMHRDETTPHIQALVVPIDEKGRLNARGFVGGDRSKLVKLQDSYAAAVQPLGLERGVRGSRAHHQDIQRWYAQMQEPAREMGHWHVRSDTEGYRPGRVLVAAGEEEASAAVKREAERVYGVVRDAWIRHGPMDEFGNPWSWLDHDYEPTKSISDTDAWVHYGLVRPPDTHVWAEPCHEPDCRLGVAGRGIWQDDPERNQESGLERIVIALGAEHDHTEHLTLRGKRLTIEGVQWRWGEQTGRGAWRLVQDKTGYDDQGVAEWLVSTLGAERAGAADTQHAQLVAKPDRVPEHTIDLDRVVIALGAEYDHKYGHWALGGEPVSVEGPRWQVGEHSGSGAIELIQHATGYDGREATVWISHTLGREWAIAATTEWAQIIVERWPAMPPYRPPERDESRWSEVRTQLIVNHALPGAVLNQMYAEGRVYADGQGRAVWLHQDEAGTVTGATLERKEGTALAPGSREGWFGTTLLGREGPGNQRRRRTLILVDTPADALATAELHRRLYGDREPGPVTVVAVDHTERIPEKGIGRVLVGGGVVRVAVKDDRLAERIGGKLLAHQHGQVVRDQPALESWCEVLRQHDLATRDPKRADRELHAKWRQNAPDEQSRASLREAVQRWGPRDPGRGGHER